MRWWMKAVLAVGVVLGMVTVGGAQQKLKVAFIYVGPIGDYGWTHAHDEARKLATKTFPWLETLYVESVPEGEVETFIDLMVRQGAQVIFTTSFGYMDGTLKAAARYPEVIFAHASGFQRAANVATYMADFYQLYYLNGLMAGALTKSGKVGYVGCFSDPRSETAHFGLYHWCAGSTPDGRSACAVDLQLVQPGSGQGSDGGPHC